eukprot:gene6119-6823_t
MASDRNYSFGTCEKELDKIHRKMKGISETIDEKIVESNEIPSTTSSKEQVKRKENETIDLQSLLICNDKEFESNLSEISTVDLDLAIMIFEQQIQMRMDLEQEQTEFEKSQVYQLRERLTKCFMKKSALTKKEITYKNKDGKEKVKKKDVLDAESISSLSSEELKVLLIYNGIKVEKENLDHQSLQNMVRKYLVADEQGEMNEDKKGRRDKEEDSKAEEEEGEDENNGEEDDWEPPTDDAFLNWKTSTLEHAENKESSKGSNSQGKTVCVDLETSKIEKECCQSSHDTAKEEEETKRNSKHQDITEEAKSDEEVSIAKVQDTKVMEESVIGPSSEEAKAESSVPIDVTHTGNDTVEWGVVVTPNTNQSDVMKSNITEQCDDSKLLSKTAYVPDKSDPTDVACKSEEQSAINWNPIPMLKDLYKNVAKPEEIQFKSKKKEETHAEVKCKMDGYLEKLPVNQLKPTMFKGWKKRYFKIARGKLFYFEDHLSTVPLGSILLTGSELKFPGEKTIQIKSQNNGDTITIRCLSSNECNDWYRTIKREAVISTPVTSPVPLALNADMPKSSTIIIDLGASTIKAGYTGEDGRKFTDSGLPDPILCKCGFDALEPETRQKSKLVFPLRPTLKIDKFAIKSRYLPGFIDKVFHELEAEPQESTVIISCQRNFGIRDKEILLDYLFGQLNVKAAYIEDQALLSLYSYRDTTGVVVDIGDHIDVVPVLEGVVVENGVSRLPQGGQLVTESLSRILSEGGYRFFSEVELYIVRFIKEQTSFVSFDYDNDLSSFENKLVVNMEKYELPGDVRSITIDDGRFRCTEGLFDPNKWGKDHLGVHKFVAKAIKQTGIDHRKEMCRKIFLSGGTTLIEGFAQRLQKELKFLMPETVNIQVHAKENRINASFTGATVISEQPSFADLIISKESWQHHGVNILNRPK